MRYPKPFRYNILFLFALGFALYIFYTVFLQEDNPEKPIALLYPKNVKLNYSLYGREDSIHYWVYGSMANYFSKIPGSHACYLFCPSDKELQLRLIDDEVQREHLIHLVEEIKKTTGNSDDQAKIAISLVQYIPFDELKSSETSPPERYPYEVIYDMKGLCGEKSKLLVFILRELGYGTALLTWEGIHQAVGVKCPNQMRYADTGYCFIETSFPIIPTHKPIEYGIYGGVKIDDNPQVTKISDGKFLYLQEEYKDAQEWKKLEARVKADPKLPPGLYLRYHYLAKKYGIKLE